MNRAAEKRLLIIPSARRGNGTGHLQRAVRLAEGFRRLGVHNAVLTEKVDSSDRYSREDIISLIPAAEAAGLISSVNPDEWDVCVFDQRETPPELFNRFSGAFLIGIDEGGTLRNNFDYLIDSLPNLETIPANISSVSFLPLPEPVKRQVAAVGGAESSPNDSAVIKVLLSFGGEDREGLTAVLAQSLIKTGLFSASELTIVRGGLFAEQDFPEGVAVLDSPENLASGLCSYDLVFTIFGLTCFEALYSGTPVILFNPTDYHRRLSRQAGIPEIGTAPKPDLNRLKQLLQAGGPLENAEIRSAILAYSGFELRDPANFIAELSIPAKRCRGCGNLHSAAAYRTETHSYFICGHCGLVNGMYFGSEQKDYGADYFFDDYKKQYGKTYLEDFEKIKIDGLRRSRLIRQIGASGRLLDIGCGYGPFLSAASDSGFRVAGTDISENAVEWVRNNLRFPASAGPVETFSPSDVGEEHFDAVTMWYVIEHLEDLPAVLDKINKMLAPGGVFAFSTPNYNGISRRRSTEAFLDANPLDHHTVWSPDSAEKLLKDYGFEIRIVKCPVIHPERFFSPGVWDGLSSAVKAVAGRIISTAGKLFSLGDTFEVYAVKKKDSSRTT
ncbi:MAG: class I SAM-dependent methyltransferase [Spirochaetales bacterium]|uniref:Class I SAM-dependent methyltransferase n=1 Tax=Candidatus Thalassospirochaeta sargassi TaxID=3119039 RepID=A0AAJ1IF58_9SPIO|nr:class I SAM-dependent methyltransferase [Spirochaetales bacterium]